MSSNDVGVLGVKDGPDVPVRKPRGFIAVARMDRDDGVKHPSGLGADQARVAAVSRRDNAVTGEIISVGADRGRRHAGTSLPFISATVIFHGMGHCVDAGLIGTRGRVAVGGRGVGVEVHKVQRQLAVGDLRVIVFHLAEMVLNIAHAHDGIAA